MNELRQEAIKWWNELEKNRRIEYWLEYKKDHLSPSFNSSELSGREVEIIYTTLKQE